MYSIFKIPPQIFFYGGIFSKIIPQFSLLTHVAPAISYNCPTFRWQRAKNCVSTCVWRKMLFSKLEISPPHILAGRDRGCSRLKFNTYLKHMAHNGKVINQLKVFIVRTALQFNAYRSDLRFGPTCMKSPQTFYKQQSLDKDSENTHMCPPHSIGVANKGLREFENSCVFQ